MVIKISRKASSAKIQQELKKLSRRTARQGFNAKKYFGKLVRGLMEMTIKRRSEMNGVDLFGDTNVLINLAEGRKWSE